MSTESRARGAAPIAVVALTFAFSLELVACPGSLENKDDFLDPCGDVPKDLLTPRCATANCHDSDMPQAGLDLTDDDGLAARLVGVSGTECSGLLVDPDAPEASLMYTKCLETNTCNARMPFTGADLTAEQEQCLLEWISNISTP